MKQFMRTFPVIVLLMIVLFAAASHAQSNWFWQQPLPAGNSLKDVKFINHQTGYAVGDVGTIVKSTNGGFNWFTLNNPKKSQLWGIDFALWHQDFRPDAFIFPLLGVPKSLQLARVNLYRKGPANSWVTNNLP